MSLQGVLGRTALKKELAPYLDILRSFKKIIAAPQYKMVPDFKQKSDHLDLGIATMEHLITLMPMPYDLPMVVSCLSFLELF